MVRDNYFTYLSNYFTYFYLLYLPALHRVLQSPTLPSKPAQLYSPECLEKLCTMNFYATTCKAINFGFTKTCASYFMGFLYGCSNFPSAEDIYNAPSVCLQELLTFVGKTQNLQQFITALHGNVVNPVNFTENKCDRRCWQNYAQASNSFKLACTPPVPNITVQKNYPITSQTMTDQEFRNQACVSSSTNETGYGDETSCYVGIQTITKAVAPDILDNFYCNYTYPYNPDTNNQLFQQYCSAFTQLKCCAANGVSLVQGNGLSPELFPPCFLGYLTKACPAVDLTDFCYYGSIATMTTFTATVDMSKTSCLNGIPDVYNKTLTQNFMGAIAQGYASAGYSAQPYGILLPNKIQITDYVYYNGKLLYNDNHKYFI